MANIIKAESTAAVKVNPKRLERLDAFLQELVDNGTHPSSAIRVLHNGTEIFSGAYGVSAPDVNAAGGGAPLTMDAIFPVASVTKSITATLLAFLQEDGVIDFCDKLKRYYPDFTGGKKDEIEIWQLLCHSSGMSDDTMHQYVLDFIKEHLEIDLTIDFSWDKYSAAVLRTRVLLGLPEADGEAAAEEAEMILKLRAPLACDPHTAFSYCNTGFILLGRLVEKLTGESIDDFAARKLFKPLNMEDTHFILPKSKWPRVVKRDPSLCFADWLNSEFALTSTSGAGGLKSTIYDLSHLGQMYLQEGTLGSEQILSPLSVRTLTSNHNAGLPASFWFGRWLGAAWGLGWHVRCGKLDDLGLLRSDRTFDHGGAGGARLIIDPENGLVISLYMVDKEELDAYPNHSRVANIIYSALVK